MSIELVTIQKLFAGLKYALTFYCLRKKKRSTKNDCERNAAKRYLVDLRREHPLLKIIITEDALSSNAPHIKEFHRHDLRYILGVKPKDHEYLFELVDKAVESGQIA